MRAILAMATFATSAAAFAQSAQVTAPAPATPQTTEAPLLVALPPQQANVVVLPANTELTLSMNDTITTKGKRWSEGDNFDMTVTHDVMLGQYVVIPKGARGVGRISYLTNKGAFGKSGKMEIDIEYVEVAGRRIPVSGHYRQEGEGNTVGTVAGVVAAGVFAGFVTGKSGTIPAGRELVARTKNDLPVAFAGPPPSTAPAPLVVAQPAPAVPVIVPAAAPAATSTAPATPATVAPVASPAPAATQPTAPAPQAEPPKN